MPSLPWSILHLSDKSPVPGEVGEGLSGRAKIFALNTHIAGRRRTNLPAGCLWGRLVQDAACAAWVKSKWHVTVVLHNV